MAMASNKDIFDEIDISPKGDIFDQIEYRPKQSGLARKAKIGGKALAQGALGTYGDILDVAGLNPREQLPGEKVRREAEFDILNKMQQPGYKPSVRDLLALSEEDDIAPTSFRLPTSRDVESLLGKEQPQGFTEELLHRGGKAIGGGLALGGGAKTLGSLLAGSTVGAGAKALGAPEVVADVADVATSLLTGRPSGKLLPKKSQKDLVEKLRAKGFSDKEITPIIQGKRKLNLLGKLSAKDEKLASRLGATKERIGSIYEGVKESSKKLGGLDEASLNKFESSVGNVLDDIRPMHRRLVNDELHDLAMSEHSIKDLVDFYQDINAKVKGVEGGKAILNKLKPSIMEAIKDISPQAAEDFKLANDLYSKLHKTAAILKPKKWEEFYDLGKIYGLAKGVVTGDLGLLAKTFTVTGARSLARELLINPKLQNFSKQIAVQVRKNSKDGVRNATQKMLDYLEKDKPDVFDELEFSNQ